MKVPRTGDPAGELDDDALIRDHLAGDEEAFGRLYRRYQAPIYTFCFRFFDDPDDAQDAFQEVFVRLLDRVGRYRPQGRFRSWIFTVARRVCVDRLRRDGTRAARLGAERRSDAEAAAEDPGAHLDDRDRVRALLAPLTPAQREVVLLSRYHGFTYPEIAEMTGRSPAAVKQMAFRALQTMRRAAAESDGLVR